MKLNGILISLVPIEKKHLPFMVKWRNDPFVSQMMFDRKKFSLKKQLAWFEKIKNDPSRKQFIIIDKKSKSPIGAINLMFIDKKNGNCDWGFYIGEEKYRMGGHAIESEYLILKYAFEKLMLHKVYCQTFDFNKKVISIHNKFGFKIDGTLRHHYKYQDEYFDIIIMSILKDEFAVSFKSIETLLKNYDR